MLELLDFILLYSWADSDFLFISVQLSYWEVFNAEEIRQLVLGRHSSLTALSISRNGEHFITATQDSLVKVTTNSIEFVLDIFELLAKESASPVKGGYSVTTAVPEKGHGYY
jgi:hypothetical protein